LANEAARLAGELELRFKNELIKDPYVLLVRLINTGNRELRVRDFIQPIRIELDAPVLSSWIVKAEPEELAPSLTWQGTAVEVAPTLFNKGDWVAVGALTDGEPKEKGISTRIVGVKRSRKFEHSRGSLSDVAPGFGWLGGIATFIMAAVLIDPLTRGKWQEWAKLADPPWQYEAIALSALAISVLVGIIVTRLIRKLSARNAESMKVVL
jgi:hypothetical protein